MGLKYLHVVQRISPQMKSALEEIPRRGGMYNWMFAFKGSIIPINEVTKELLEQYDVVQINLSPVDQLMVKRLRDMLGNSSTLLIGNNDYVVETWDTWNQHPSQYLQTQEMCDAVFGTEPYQVSFMRDDSFVIPHPHWIKMLKSIGIDDLELDRFKVGALYHWWEGKSYTTSLIFDKLRRKYPRLITKLYSYMEVSKDRALPWHKVMFDKIAKAMNYPSFITNLTSNRFIFEPCSYHTYGRTSVDCAAIGVPCVGSYTVWSMQYCFPELSCDPYNCSGILDRIDKILRNNSWLDKQLDYASEACEYFNYEQSIERYMNMVDVVRDRLK